MSEVKMSDVVLLRMDNEYVVVDSVDVYSRSFCVRSSSDCLHEFNFNDIESVFREVGRDSQELISEMYSALYSISEVLSGTTEFSTCEIDVDGIKALLKKSGLNKCHTQT